MPLHDTMRRRPLPALLLISALSGCDSTESPTGPRSEAAAAPTASAVISFLQLNSGSFHNCAVATDNRGYCWGYNANGQVGNGTTSFERLTPALVVGGLKFRQISAGSYHACGVTMTNLAYCWGFAPMLGDGKETNSPRPVRVAGGLKFRQVSAGDGHTCGVTTDDRAFCWGHNTFGQLGNGIDGSGSTPDLAPVAVIGGHRFKGVSVGVHHSCGVTTSGDAYCWGGDQWGQVGDGPASDTCIAAPNPRPCRLNPTLVTGGLTWRQVDAGGGGGSGEGEPENGNGGRTCGVTTDNRAFCWGDGTNGQNGDGTRMVRHAPRAVAGGLVFRSVSTGQKHSCGVTTNNRTYCWGWNDNGQLGDGTVNTIRLKPRRFVGGQAFTQVTAGGSGTCALTAAGAGYCWGFYVGNGSGERFETPQPVG